MSYDRGDDDGLREPSAGHGGDGAGVVSHEEISVHPGANTARSLDSPSAESIADTALHSGWLGKRGYTLHCLPTWKRRFCILKGQYLFKFDSPTADHPKGAPIPVLGITCTLGPVDPKPSDHSHTMTLSTLRKDYVMGAASREELQAWMDVIAVAKNRAIKQQLGHLPLSESDAFANRSGDLLTQKRLDRETDEVEHSQVHSVAY